MKKLSQSQESARAKLIEDLNKSKSEIEDVIVEINKLINEKLNVKVNEYNDILSEAVAYRDSVTEVMSDYYENKSEKWQESDAGSAYENWKSEWESIDLEDIVPFEDIANPDDFSHAEALDDLSPEVEQE